MTGLSVFECAVVMLPVTFVGEHPHPHIVQSMIKRCGSISFGLYSTCQASVHEPTCGPVDRQLLRSEAAPPAPVRCSVRPVPHHVAQCGKWERPRTSVAAR